LQPAGINEEPTELAGDSLPAKQCISNGGLMGAMEGDTMRVSHVHLSATCTVRSA
jgi:hypothetical protein